MLSAPFSCIIMANVKMDDTVLFKFSWRPQKVETMLMHLLLLSIFFFFWGGVDKNKVYYGQYMGSMKVVIVTL